MGMMMFVMGTVMLSIYVAPSLQEGLDGMYLQSSCCPCI